jgi:hypothetical protein
MRQWYIGSFPAVPAVLEMKTGSTVEKGLSGIKLFKAAVHGLYIQHRKNRERERDATDVLLSSESFFVQYSTFGIQKLAFITTFFTTMNNLLLPSRFFVAVIFYYCWMITQMHM